jgi:hypothetical protein
MSSTVLQASASPLQLRQLRAERQHRRRTLRSDLPQPALRHLDLLADRSAHIEQASVPILKKLEPSPAVSPMPTRPAAQLDSLEVRLRPGLADPLLPERDATTVSTLV